MVIIGFGCIIGRHEFVTRHFPHGPEDGLVADPTREELFPHHVIPLTLARIGMHEGLKFHTHSGHRQHERQTKQRDEKQRQDCHKNPSMFTYDVEHELLRLQIRLLIFIENPERS